MESTTTQFGSMELHGTSYTITYTELSGDYAGCTTTLQVDEANRFATVTREGPNTSILTMEEGVRHLCQYDTPYGSFLMGIHAHEVRSSMSRLGGVLDLNYDIDVAGSLISHICLHLSLKEIF